MSSSTIKGLLIILSFLVFFILIATLCKDPELGFLLSLANVIIHFGILGNLMDND